MKVAILGKCNGKLHAPYSNKQWQIWGCNKHKDFEKILRYDLWFDIHKKRYEYNIPAEKLVTFKTYPFEEVNKELFNGKNFCNNSISYMIAYAIYKGATDISLYGCKFDIDFEQRKAEKQNVINMLYFAMGKGLNVESYEGLLAEVFYTEMYK